jgi:predicted SprT family Zn-dependent metalloprotease
MWLHKTKKRLSKGMRKHIRWEKAEKRKEEAKKLVSNHQRGSIPNLPKEELPSYQDIPRVNKGPYSYRCPHCLVTPRSTDKITIKTKEGARQVYRCNNCQNIYRP